MNLRERETDRERCERETPIGYLLYMPQLGIEPAAFLAYGTMLQPIEPPGPLF